MKKATRNILLAVCFAAVILPMLAGKPSAADKRKAEYAFMEAISKKEAGDIDAAYALLRHAVTLDPDNPTINYYVGFTMLNLDRTTEEEVDSATALMRINTIERPGDYYENYVYAILNASLNNHAEATRVLENLAKRYPAKTELFPMLAKSYAAQGNFDKAIATIDSLEKTEGRTVTTTSMKVNYLFNTGDTAAIINNGKLLLHDAPNSAVPNALMGNIFAQLNMPDSAFAYYDRALIIEPDYGYANLQKAYLYNSLGDSTNYEKEISATLLNKNIDVDTKVDILTDYIRDCIQQGDSSARVDNMFRTILNQHPHEAQIRHLFSDYLSFKKDYKNAAEQLSYVLDIDPSDPKNWERLIWLEIFNNNYDKAIESGKKAVEYAPDELSLYQALGFAYFKKEDYSSAIATYDTLLVRNKDIQMVDEADIHTSLGDIYQQIGDTANAIKNYEAAININPSNALTLNNFAYFLCTHKKDRIDDAARMAEMALAADPDNGSYLDTYALVLFLKHDYKKALEFIEKAAEHRDSDTGNAELWEHYGDILFMLGKPAEAVEKWKDALKDNPGSKLLKKKIENKTYFYE